MPGRRGNTSNNSHKKRRMRWPIQELKFGEVVGPLKPGHQGANGQNFLVLALYLITFGLDCREEVSEVVGHTIILGLPGNPCGMAKRSPVQVTSRDRSQHGGGSHPGPARRRAARFPLPDAPVHDTCWQLAAPPQLQPAPICHPRRGIWPDAASPPPLCRGCLQAPWRVSALSPPGTAFHGLWHRGRCIDQARSPAHGRREHLMPPWHGGVETFLHPGNHRIPPLGVDCVPVG